MRILFLFILSIGSTWSYAQHDGRISTLDFVQILNDNTEEAYFYYQNNWKKLREAAIEMNYIHSYEIMETASTDEAPFHLVLVTTYANEKAYAKREERFSRLIEQAGELKLLNEKKPTEFRKNLFNKKAVRHWNTKIRS